MTKFLVAYQETKCAHFVVEAQDKDTALEAFKRTLHDESFAAWAQQRLLESDDRVAYPICNVEACPNADVDLYVKGNYKESQCPTKI